MQDLIQAHFYHTFWRKYRGGLGRLIAFNHGNMADIAPGISNKNKIAFICYKSICIH